MKTLKTWVAAAAMVALTGGAQAALVSLGDGTVKDTNTNLIWLQNWNVNGLANWGAQRAWAETTLDGFAGSNDWRLPAISEYDALLAAYGNLTQVAEFTGVQSGYYWSGTQFVWGLGSWSFLPSSGVRQGYAQSLALYAVAVRPNNVTASVPEPQTLALALLALGATMVVRRRSSR